MKIFTKGDRVWPLDESKGRRPLTFEEVWGNRVSAIDSRTDTFHEFNSDDLGFVPAEHETLIEDEYGMSLSHYIIAERMTQYDAYLIQKHINEDNDYDSLIHTIAYGSKGYHNMTNDELLAEWGDCEEGWHGAYQEGSLLWETYEDDPISILDRDEHGEAEWAGRKGK